MALLKVDTEALLAQAELHQQLAQFCHEASGQLHGYGRSVANAFSQWSGGHGSAYERWLQPSAQSLAALAVEQEHWADVLRAFVQNVDAVEQQVALLFQPDPGPF